MAKEKVQKRLVLPPDPDEFNSNRADWAGLAVDTFQGEAGTEDKHAVADLICNLGHFLDRNPDYGTLAEAIRRGRSYYEEETDSEGKQFVGGGA
jgi:hypothetical protein